MEDYDKLHKLWYQAHVSGSPIKFVRNEIVFRELANLEPGNTLDVGCGIGEYSVFLAKYGHKVTAFDPSSFAIKSFRKNADRFGIKTEVNTIEGFQSSEPFDNIVSIEVMEHIESDTAFLKKLHSILKPGGTLIISVPATEFLYSEADRISGHYRRYSYQYFSKVLTNTGFIHLRIKRYGFPILFIYLIIRKIFLDKLLIRHFASSDKKIDRKSIFISKYYPFILKIDQLDKPLWSVGYVATCRK